MSLSRALRLSGLAGTECPLVQLSFNGLAFNELFTKPSRSARGRQKSCPCLLAGGFARGPAGRVLRVVAWGSRDRGLLFFPGSSLFASRCLFLFTSLCLSLFTSLCLSLFTSLSLCLSLSLSLFTSLSLSLSLFTSLSLSPSLAGACWDERRKGICPGCWGGGGRGR